MTHAPVREGDVLAGKYAVERVLGVGGMGVVVAAHHLQLDQRVALKFLLPEMAGSSQVVARFLREGRAAAKIRSEHVARVHDVGTLDTGAPYLVMEYLNGQDLSAVVQARGGLPVTDAVDYVLQASEAIAEAHALGIVHRDLKPHNLFLISRNDGSPCVKVLDFGISKALSSDSAHMTGTAAMIGSPLYMSPEQMSSSRDADARTDIWALGVILFELLAGTTPFDADTIPLLIVSVMQQPPAQLTALRPDVPPALESVILRCLEKDLTRRFQTVAELAHALAPFASPRQQGSPERISRILGVQVSGPHPALAGPGAEPARSVPESSATDAGWGQTRSPTPRRPLGLVIGGAAVGVALLAGAGVLYARTAVPEAQQPAASADPATAAFVPPPSAVPVEPPPPAPSVEPPAASSTAPVPRPPERPAAKAAPPPGTKPAPGKSPEVPDDRK